MTIMLIVYAVLLCCCVAAIYGLYKLVWYIIKMISFKRFIKRLPLSGATIDSPRSFWNIIFGKTVAVDYVVKNKDETYTVSVLSFISTHGRWNIEKTRNHFYVECRRGSKFFYKKHINSNTPDHVEEYKNESRISRKELILSPVDPSFEKQILLLYPYPKRVTYTDAHFNELFIGDTVEGHTLMDIKSFEQLFCKEHNIKES